MHVERSSDKGRVAAVRPRRCRSTVWCALSYTTAQSVFYRNTFLPALPCRIPSRCCPRRVSRRVRYIPAIRELVACAGFTPDVRWIARTLSRGCSPPGCAAGARAKLEPPSAANSRAKPHGGRRFCTTVLARFGSAARGDPLYDADVQLGRLLRTAFLADYFNNEVFHRESRRVVNRGEAVNIVKRAIYSGRVNPFQARRSDAVATRCKLLPTPSALANNPDGLEHLAHAGRARPLVDDRIVTHSGITNCGKGVRDLESVKGGSATEISGVTDAAPRFRR